MPSRAPASRRSDAYVSRIRGFTPLETSLRAKEKRAEFGLRKLGAICTKRVCIEGYVACSAPGPLIRGAQKQLKRAMRCNSFHQPISPLSILPRSLPHHQPSSGIDGFRHSIAPLEHRALLSDFGQNLLRTVILFSAPRELEQYIERSINCGMLA